MIFSSSWKGIIQPENSKIFTVAAHTQYKAKRRAPFLILHFQPCQDSWLHCKHRTKVNKNELKWYHNCSHSFILFWCSDWFSTYMISMCLAVFLQVISVFPEPWCPQWWPHMPAAFTHRSNNAADAVRPWVVGKEWFWNSNPNSCVATALPFSKHLTYFSSWK